MTPVQQRLREMLAELVAICEEHGIEYYAAGGTTLGALRHGGFIPWDDDVDLMMPRRDWLRFIEIARQGLPEGRALACLELDENYHQVFGRYVDTTSTSIHDNQFLGEGIEGIVIDIFILDPVPDACDSFAAHRETLSLFNDLVNDMGYSYPMSSDKKRLKRYMERVEQEGRRAVFDELEAELSRHEDGDYLVMRWAAAPRLFHKSIFALPRWEQFEGLRVRVPGKCADYLVQHYGDDWMYLPSGEGRVTHDTITFVDVDYKTFQADYLPSIDVERTRRAILNRRAYRIDHLDALRAADDAEASSRAEVVRCVTLQRAASAGIDPSCDFQAATADLDWVFGEFYRWQGSALLSGREEYRLVRRYYEPVLVDIGDDLLRLAVFNLVASNRVGLAHRLLRVRELAGGPLHDAALEARRCVDLVRKPASLADVGCVDDALELSRTLLEDMPWSFSNWVLLAELLLQRGDFDELERVASRAADLFPQAGEFAKFQADCAYEAASSADGRRAAFELLLQALGHTTNGLIAADVAALAVRDAAELGPDAQEAVRKAVAGAVQEVPRATGGCDAREAEGGAERLPITSKLALHRASFLRWRIKAGMAPLVNDLRVRKRALLRARLSGDRKRWHDRLDAQVPEIEDLVSRGDVEGLARLYSGYRADALRYLSQGMCLCPSEEHLATLCMLLREEGKAAEARKLMRLVDPRHLVALGHAPEHGDVASFAHDADEAPNSEGGHE